MSKVVRFHQTGQPDVLRIADENIAAPAEHEIQIKVITIGLNRAEAMFRQGMYLEQPKLPAGLGYESAGVVTAIGTAVTGFKVGDSVSTIPNFSMNQYGVYAELTNVPASAVAHHPKSLAWSEACSIWMQYLTAYGALIDIANIQPDDVVVITAASSSVGLAAIQLCNVIGAIPVAVTRTADKKAALSQHGAKHVIVTEDENLVDRVNDITDSIGARVIFDPVAGPLLNQLADIAAPQGIIFQYGALSPEPTPFPLFPVLGKGLTIRGYTLFEFTRDSARLSPAKNRIYEWLESGQIKPVVAKQFILDDIVQAHQYLESNQQLGKIVVTV